MSLKKTFVQLHQKHGLQLACAIKKIGCDVGFKWIKAFRDGGFEKLADKRVNNSETVNELLDNYVLNQIIQKSALNFPVNGLLLVKTIAVCAPSYLKPQAFSSSDGWLQRFLNRYGLVRRKKTHQSQDLIDYLTKESKVHLSTFVLIVRLDAFSNKSIELSSNMEEESVYLPYKRTIINNKNQNQRAFVDNKEFFKFLKKLSIRGHILYTLLNSSKCQLSEDIKFITKY